MRQGRGLAGVIVAGKEQHPTVSRRPRGVAMLERVAAAIDAWPFGVPHRKYAVVFGAGKQIELLSSPDRGCPELLIDRGLKVDVAPFEKPSGIPQSLIEAT